jgi:hypothetical protein
LDVSAPGNNGGAAVNREAKIKPDLTTLVIRVVMPPAFGLRVRLVMLLLKLAAWVSPVTLEVSADDEPWRSWRYDRIDDPPVRYAVGQPDYDPSVGMRLVVCLDGEEAKEVVAYDCEAGWILQHRRDKAGQFVIDRAHECIASVRTEGKITVGWRD